MTEILVSDPVEAFVKALAPDPRTALRVAIRALESGAGDLKSLEGELLGWTRLRVMTYRVIYKERWEAGERIIDCVFANRRSVVYEMFKELLRNQILRD